MRYVTERFGEIEIAAEDVCEFPLGIIGFPEYRTYAIHRDSQLYPFVWLQSLEEPRLCFFVVEPFIMFPEYEVEVKLDKGLEADLGAGSDLLVLGIVNIATEFARSTVNLLAPLIVNKARRVGYQLVMEEKDYTTRHRLFADPDTADTAREAVPGVHTA